MSNLWKGYPTEIHQARKCPIAAQDGIQASRVEMLGVTLALVV